MYKVNADNSGQQVTLETQHISVMNKSFGLKNELTTQSHCAAGHRFVLKIRAKTSKNSTKLWKQAGIYLFHCLL